MTAEAFASSDRFRAAIAAFDAQNSLDPRPIEDDTGSRPAAVAEADRLLTWILALDPAPSEALLLAARAQHLRRWERPRADYPEGRKGYLQWRAAAAQFHAAEAEAVLRSVGYGEDIVSQVRAIVTKQGLATGEPHPDVRTMEDALCLAFVEHELPAFAARHDPTKVAEILERTSRKMSVRAREIAANLLAAR